MDSEEIHHLARLSRIEVSGEEVAGFQKDFQSIVGYIDTLRSVDVGDTSDVSHYLTNSVRDDSVTESAASHTDSLMREVPTQEGGYVEVRKVLDRKKRT